jgi:hypothetical protein
LLPAYVDSATAENSKKSGDGLQTPEGDLEDIAPSATELPEGLADWLYVARIAVFQLRTRHLPRESLSRQSFPARFGASVVLKMQQKVGIRLSVG